MSKEDKEKMIMSSGRTGAKIYRCGIHVSFNGSGQGNKNQRV
jgi:hypothetical protein